MAVGAHQAAQGPVPHMALVFLQALLSAQISSREPSSATTLAYRQESEPWQLSLHPQLAGQLIVALLQAFSPKH
jgi:hypothetical protein